MADNFIGIGLGATSLTVAGFAATDQADRTVVTMPDPTPAGPSGTATYLWSWLRQPGSATFSSTTVAQPTVTPDVEGEWVAVCVVTLDGQAVEFLHTFRIGVPLLNGPLAEVVFDLDLPTLGGAAEQDFSGGGVFTIGGIDFTVTNTGTATTNKLNANGWEFTDDTGSGSVYAVLALAMSEISAAPGDVVFFVVEQSWQAANDNTDRVAFRFAQTVSGAGDHNMWAQRIGAADYRYGISQSTTPTNNGQIDTSILSAMRVVQACDGSRCDHWVDNAGGAVAVPSDVTYVGSTTISPVDGTSVGSRQDPWTTLDYWHISPFCANSDASYYTTRIACFVVRNTYGDI